MDPTTSMRRRSRYNRERVEATRKGEKTRARTETREGSGIARVAVIALDCSVLRGQVLCSAM